MAYASLVSLTKTIDQFLNNDKYSIPVHIKKQMLSIHKHVVSLQEFLENFLNKACNLEGQIRDTENEAEKKIEELMLDFLFSDHDNSNELETATREIELIAEQVMNIKNSSRIEDDKLLTSFHVAASSSTFLPIIKDVMVGFDYDLMKTKDHLCGMSSMLEVIPIFGMGGIGKTTLARNAYEDSLITEYFHIRAWVTISLDYNTREVLSSLLVSMKVPNEELCGQGSIHESLNLSNAISHSG